MLILVSAASNRNDKNQYGFPSPYLHMITQNNCHEVISVIISTNEASLIHIQTKKDKKYLFAIFSDVTTS